MVFVRSGLVREAVAVLGYQAPEIRGSVLGSVNGVQPERPGEHLEGYQTEHLRDGTVLCNACFTFSSSSICVQSFD